MIKQGKDMSIIDEVIEKLRLGKPLESKYKDHELTGNFKFFRECHLKPDWLFIYMIRKNILVFLSSKCIFLSTFCLFLQHFYNAFTGTNHFFR